MLESERLFREQEKSLMQKHHDTATRVLEMERLEVWKSGYSTKQETENKGGCFKPCYARAGMYVRACCTRVLCIYVLAKIRPGSAQLLICLHVFVAFVCLFLGFLLLLLRP
jgi:hypothetical protein